jgi:hypothetical protein
MAAHTCVYILILFIVFLKFTLLWSVFCFKAPGKVDNITVDKEKYEGQRQLQTKEIKNSPRFS